MPGLKQIKSLPNHLPHQIRKVFSWLATSMMSILSYAFSISEKNDTINASISDVNSKMVKKIKLCSKGQLIVVDTCYVMKGQWLASLSVSFEQIHHKWKTEEREQHKNSQITIKNHLELKFSAKFKIYPKRRLVMKNQHHMQYF